MIFAEDTRCEVSLGMGHLFCVHQKGQGQEPLVASLLLVAMPFAPSSVHHKGFQSERFTGCSFFGFLAAGQRTLRRTTGLLLSRLGIQLNQRLLLPCHAFNEVPAVWLG